MRVSPRVSVVVPVHDNMATLARCFDSIFDQTMPAEQVEIVAVDDGSADGSGEALDRMAETRPGFVVVHQEASGGPGRPRNVGIEKATGEYVFFLDADDYLGPEALERCCAMADANGTDVVVPKYVGVNRRISTELFKRDVPFTTIQDSPPNLYGSITALKMYRRSMLDRHAIRFPEGILSGEDQIFAVAAYFKAKGVSVVAGHDCYYWVYRDDGSSALQQGGAPAALFYPEIGKLMRYVAEHTEPGPVRDRLFRRHFQIEVFTRFDRRYLRMTEQERRATRDGARPLVAEWFNPQIAAGLPAHLRVIAFHLGNGTDDAIEELIRMRAEGGPPVVMEGDRAYLGYPGFRAGVPDECFLTTHLFEPIVLDAVEWRDGLLRLRARLRIQRAEADQPPRTAELVLRRREDALEHRIPLAESGTDEDLTGTIDLGQAAGGGPLGPGRWDIWGVVKVGGFVREGRFQPAGDPPVTMPGAAVAPVADGVPTVLPYLTKGGGYLALGVGTSPGPTLVAKSEVTSPSRGTLRVVTELRSVLPDGDGLIAARGLLRRRGAPTEERATDLTVRRVPGALELVGELSLGGARPGTWDLYYEIAAGPHTIVLRAPAPARLPESGRRYRVYATVQDNLSVAVRGRMGKALRRRVARRSRVARR